MLFIKFFLTQSTSCAITDGTWNTVLVDKTVDDYTLSLNPEKGYGQSSIHTSRVSKKTFFSFKISNSLFDIIWSEMSSIKTNT